MGLLLAGCILFYNAIHKIIGISLVLMGGCRFLVYLAAASVAVNGVTGESIWKGLALACYIVGLSCLARKENAPVRIQYWPCIFLVAPVLVAVLFDDGPDQRAAAVCSGAADSLGNLDVAPNIRAGAPQRRTRRFPPAGRDCVGGFAGRGGLGSLGRGFFPFCSCWRLLLQRFIPAT